MLAEKRAEVISKFYQDKMAQYDYKGLADSIKFDKKVIFQDWNEFTSAVDSSDNLTDNERVEVKEIIASSSKSYEETEKELQKLSFYSKLVKEIYSELRYSKTEIWSIKPKKTDAEISILAKGIVNGSLSKDTLSAEELLYAATLTPLKDEKEGIYEVAVRNNNSWQANNNLGAIYLDRGISAITKSEASGFYKKALIQFDLSLKKMQNAEALNNKAAIQVLVGKKDDALETYKLAAQAQASDSLVKEGIKAGLGTIYIKKGEYESAIVNLISAGKSAGVLYNLGLAQLLSKDFTSAGNSFENAVYTDKKLARGYYCLAIVGARTENTDLVERLGEGIKLDADLREKALGDLEFLKYKETESFKNAIK